MHMRRKVVSTLVSVLALASGGRAWAQGTDTSIDVNTYWPAPGPGNYFGVRGSAINPHLGVGFTLDLNYQHRPLVLQDTESSDELTAVEYQVTADFLWSFGLFDWVQIGLGLPTVLAQDGVGASPLVTGGLELATTAIRDLRIEVKGRFLGRGPHGTTRYGFGLGAVASITVPTGDRDNFAGDHNVVGEPILIADYTHEYFSVAANVGARLRDASRFADVEVGHQLTFGVAGAGYLVDRRLQLLAELVGLAGLTGTDTMSYQGEDVEVRGNDVHLELRAGVGYTPDHERDITIRVGGAAGLTTAPGVPQFRVIASLQYQPMNADQDGDGVLDRDDGCDDQQEDMDEFDDEDGCPDLDNDEDGISDASDQCPDEAEDADEFQDDDGCPDFDNDSDQIPDEEDNCPGEAEDVDEFEDEDGCPDPDNDDDGVPDGQDQCAAEAEDRDGFEDADGCPDPDNDGDGIPDADDACPDAAEDVDQHEDGDGCPDLDNDGDGVADADDRCPDEAETINGFNDSDGCRDTGTGVTLSADRFVLRGALRFAARSAALPAALGRQLDQVALHMRTAALAGRVLGIYCLADTAGDTDENRTLARSRAEAIRDAIVARGIPTSRIEIISGNLDRRVTGLQAELSLLEQGE
jgi:outer membrane protein OmpA-like peptidoglycan-associated protein